MIALLAKGHLASNHGSRIGGKSGGVLNEDLVRELEEVALEHVRKPTLLTTSGAMNVINLLLKKLRKHELFFPFSCYPTLVNSG